MNKDKFLSFMETRCLSLKDKIDRDFNGGLHSYNEVLRELKWLKEATERGEFDD